MKVRNYFLCVLALTIFGQATAQAADQLKVKTFKISGDLTLELFGERVLPGWSAQDSKLAKIFTHDEISDTGRAYLFGQSLNLDFAYRPTARWSGDLGLLFIGNYADRYWLPINDEHRLKDTGQFVKWTQGEVKYKGDRLSAQLFGGIGHYHWGEEGDMFGFYTEQFDVYNYRRVSGRQVPRGLDIKMFGEVGRLELATGSELIWGNGYSTYGKYNWRNGIFNNAFIFKDEKIKWGQPNEHLRAYQLTTKIDWSDYFPMEFGLLYQPFRKGKDYTYVEETDPGKGYLGSGYQIRTGKTSTGDGFGVKTKVGTKVLPYIEEAYVHGAYQGLTAGNKQEIGVEIHKDLSGYTNLIFDFTYREPLIGPLPYLYEGTETDPGPAITLPRSRNDAFWVTWDNRKAKIISLTYNFDPTPASWFYLWQPNILEEWNMNPKEDATLAFALQYIAAIYPTTTDAWWYTNREETVLWEGEADPTTPDWEYRPYGKWATNKWIHYFNLMSKFNPAPGYKYLVNLRGGQSLATAGLSYTTSSATNKPITNFFLGSISLDKKPYKANFTYGKNVWGPEEWHQRFGESIDALYKFSLSRTWADIPLKDMDSDLGIEYIGCREKDNKYLSPELGSFDQWRLYYTLHFGTLISFAKEEKKVIVTPPPPLTPPLVKMTISNPEFSPDGDGVEDSINFDLEATHESGIKNWEIKITNAEGKIVKSIQGDGTPPASMDWDGVDDIYNKVAPEGDYTATLTATNNDDKSATTQPESFILKIAPQVIVKEILKEVPVQVKEEARGLVISMTSTVLYDFGKWNLKTQALKVLDEIAKVLKAYPTNKINIEGHTDAVGSDVYNLKLSEKRARSVGEYLIKQGIESTRMNIIGLGEAKPIATNKTKEGRAQNRRVEIVILKEEGEELKRINLQKGVETTK